MLDQELTTACIEAATATLAGRRALNADASLVDQAAGLFAVADGMRALPRSRDVALAALRAVRDTFQAPWVLLPHPERTPDEAGERLVHGIARAHAQFYEPSTARAARIGTTFAGLVVCGGGSFTVAHVGSSRVYLLRRASRMMVRLTNDHTVLGASHLWGQLGAEAPRASDARTLTQAIGATRRVDPMPVVERWEPGDVAMLCTDGVSNPVEPEDIAAILLRAGHLGETARRLVRRAREAGGSDDATVVLVRQLSWMTVTQGDREETHLERA